MVDDESGVCSVFRSHELTNPQFLLVPLDTTVMPVPAFNPAKGFPVQSGPYFSCLLSMIHFARAAFSISVAGLQQQSGLAVI